MTEPSLFIYFLALFGAFLAGGINTMAGNGSAITLTILTEMLGLPPNIANGTNRVGILTQSMAAGWTFQRAGKLDVKGSKLIIVLITLGALAGIYVATQVSNEQFREVFRYLMVVMFFIILIRPKRWLRETDVEAKVPLWLHVPLYLLLGFHAGFIQMGMGVLFLAIAVLVSRYSIMDSNAIKIVAVGIITAIALAVFAWQGMVDWRLGGLMAIGQTLGGYLTARFAVRDPRASLWAYRLLVFVIIVAILRLFELF